MSDRLQRIELPYGNSRLKVSLPAGWLGEIIQPLPTSAASEPDQSIQFALDHPIGAPRIENLAAAGQKVAILVDDHTRKSPTREMLGHLLVRLDTAGVRQIDICIILALGSHRSMSKDEIELKLGAEIAARFEIVNTPSSQSDEFKYLGTTNNGIPVSIQRRVAEADLRIGLGMITPHMDAGFSGGAKIILPGVCSDQTIDAFHMRSAYQQANPLGNENCALRLDLESAVAGLTPLDFIINSIPTINDGFHACVAGHPVTAHRAGVKLARDVFRATARKTYPVVLACCYPYEHDLWQSIKGLWCADLLTADGGSLVLLAYASEGAQQTPLLLEYIGSDPSHLMRRLVSGGCDDPKAAATGIMVGRIKQRIRISLVSHGLDRTDARLMGLPYFKSVQDAVGHAVGRLQPTDKPDSIGVIPNAGLVLPVIESTIPGQDFSPRRDWDEH